MNIVLALLFACLMFAPPLFGAEKHPAVSYKMLKDTGWNVCRDMVKNLNRLQPSAASFCCDLRFHPKMTQFSEPEWEELNIEDYWQEVYELEKQLQYFFPRIGNSVGKLHPFFSPKPFAEWRELYLQSMREGRAWGAIGGGQEDWHLFRPRLRKTQVLLEQNGSFETILAYSLLSDYGTVCKNQESLCPTPPWVFGRPSPLSKEEQNKRNEKCRTTITQKRGGVYTSREKGDYLVLYHPETRKITWILQGNDGQIYPCHLFLYNQRAYTLSISGTSWHHIARIYKPSKEHFLSDSYWQQIICTISRPDFLK